MYPEPPKHNKFLIIIIVLLILAGLVIGGYFIYKKQTNLTQTAVTKSPSPIASATPGKSSRNDPNGPYYHQIYSATSNDGISWEKQNKLLFEHSSVPGAVVKNDKIYLYFVDASGNEDQVSVALSDDNGKTFSSKQKAVVSNGSSNMVDPHPELVGDKIRLYYMSSEMPTDQAVESKEPSDFKIMLAESADGINFENPRQVYKSDQIITDPDVFRTDKDWRMFLSEGRNLILTISTDGGLTFSKDNNFSWNKGGVCDTAKIGDVYRTYYCGEGGIASATGAETGVLTAENGARITGVSGQIICDPSVVKLADGTYLMFYKIQEAKDQNQQKNPPSQPPIQSPAP